MFRLTLFEKVTKQWFGKIRQEDDLKEKQTKIRLMSITANFAVIFFGIGANLIIKFAPHLVVNYQRIDSFIIRVVLTLFFVAIAVGLFELRKRNLFIYATAEIGFGVASVARAVPQLEDSPSGWLVVVASMYIIVRGLVNYEEAKKRRIQ